MVSFQCEGCGDVQTKKKLDSHRNQCHAPFTCIDCMTTFRGTEYRSHTSCMTEDQKYQGHLYREKPTKANKRKSVSILEPTNANALIPRQAYVEDLVHNEIPPEAPTPPSAVPNKSADSVFDFLVEDESQSTPRITFTERKVDQEEMAIKKDAPSVFSRPTSRNDYRTQEERNPDQAYEANGFSYGTTPVNPRPLDMNASSLTLDFMTPAAKVTKSKLDKQGPGSVSHSRTNSGSEKKRKRAQADENSGTDTAMLDVPDTIVRQVVDTPGVVHSGLTGGLSRMVTADDEFPSPYNRSPSASPNPQHGPAPVRQSTKREDPASPLKRTRHSKDDTNGLGISIKGRAGKVLSMVGGALAPTVMNNDGVLVKTRRRASSSDHTNQSKDRNSDEKRERKKHKVTRHNGTASANVRHERVSSRRPHAESPSIEAKRKMKTIEYNKTHNGNNSNTKQEYSNSDSDDRPSGLKSQNQDPNKKMEMVVFGAEEQMRNRCETFLSYVTKGSRSERGYSIHKALKRWHRDREVYSSSVKLEEEKELWRYLRLRRNENGEVVLFF